MNNNYKLPMKKIKKVYSNFNKINRNKSKNYKMISKNN